MILWAFLLDNIKKYTLSKLNTLTGLEGGA